MNRPSVKTVIDAIRASALVRQSDVRQLRAATRSTLIERRLTRHTNTARLKRTRYEDRLALIASMHPLAASGQPPHGDAVLAVIRNHPDGISPLDIGNELGMNWRALIPIMRRLVDTGAVDQIDHELYPAGTASPIC
jgi:hypothetical protein